MSEGFKIGGHPVHVMVVHFPIGLCLASVVVDVIAVWTGSETLWSAGRVMLVGGLIGAGTAVVTGFVDYVALLERRGEELANAANRHLLSSMTGICAFLGSWLLRKELPETGLDYFPVGLSIVGGVLILLAARFGGALVFDFGVGVTDSHS